ncbi:MAG: SMP-30/gluconolactonase/LRE family protein [Bacteroidia bacterium]
MCSCTEAPEEEKTPVYLASDFTAEGGFTSGIEGPAADTDGNLYVVNFAEQGTIGKVSPTGEAEVFVHLPEGSIGNGIRIDQAGMLYIADYPQHNILKIDPATKAISVYAHDSTMNQPNDIAITSAGVLFASDPNWKESTGNLWRIDTDGSVVLLESGLSTTNGVEVSPDEKRLYVNESVSRKVWVYDLSPEGNISNKRLLTEFPDFGMDGMRCDAEGNLYITRHGKGTVAIISPSGELLHEVTLTGKKPSNITFGGPDGKSCYITLQDRGCLETFRAEIPGRSWVMSHKP